MNKKTNAEVNFGLLDSFRQTAMEYFYQSMMDDGEEITEDLIDVVNHVWHDLENYMIFNGGDLNELLNMGLEILIETAIDMELHPEMIGIE